MAPVPHGSEEGICRICMRDGISSCQEQRNVHHEKVSLVIHWDGKSHQRYSAVIQIREEFGQSRLCQEIRTRQWPVGILFEEEKFTKTEKKRKKYIYFHTNIYLYIFKFP